LQLQTDSGYLVLYIIAYDCAAFRWCCGIWTRTNCYEA